MKRAFHLTILFILLFTFYIKSDDQPALARFGGSPGAPDAYFQRAVNLMNAQQYGEGALYLQEIINWFPDSELANRARQLNTIVFRLHIASPADNRTYIPDTNFGGTVAEIGDPGGLAIDSKQNLYYADKDKKTLTAFDATGKQTSNTTLTSPYGISINDKDEVLIANDDAAVQGNHSISFTITDSKGNVQGLQEIRSITIDASGKYYVVSGKYPGILIFDANKTQVSNSPLSSLEKQYYKVLMNHMNQVCALDKDRKQILTFDKDGKVVSSIGPAGKGYELNKIEDFAIDPLNHIYILEKNPRSVLIFSPSGALMKYILSDKKSPLVFDDARVITVGPSGSIYLLDKDQHRILKIG